MCRFGSWGERRKENGASTQGGCWHSATELQTAIEGLWEVIAVSASATSGYAAALALYLTSLLESEHKEQSRDSAAQLQSPEYFTKPASTEDKGDMPRCKARLMRYRQATSFPDFPTRAGREDTASGHDTKLCSCLQSCKGVRVLQQMLLSAQLRSSGQSLLHRPAWGCSDLGGTVLFCYITKAFSCVRSFSTAPLYRIIVEDEKYCYF